MLLEFHTFSSWIVCFESIAFQRRIVNDENEKGINVRCNFISINGMLFVLYGFLKTMVLEILYLVRFERALDPVVIFHSRTKVCQWTEIEKYLTPVRPRVQARWLESFYPRNAIFIAGCFVNRIHEPLNTFSTCNISRFKNWLLKSHRIWYAI